MIYVVDNSQEVWNVLEHSIIPIDILYEGIDEMRIEVDIQYGSRFVEMMKTTSSEVREE